jgi:hypothetical protein
VCSKRVVEMPELRPKAVIVGKVQGELIYRGGIEVVRVVGESVGDRRGKVGVRHVRIYR